MAVVSPFAACGGRVFELGVRQSGSKFKNFLDGVASGRRLGSYLLAAITAIASESGAISSHIHRPFSLLCQLLILISVFQLWGKGERVLVGLNLIAWGAILCDTALHFLLAA